MPSINHYTAYCNNYLINELNVQFGKSYYYDDLLNKGEIKIIRGLVKL